MQFTCYKAGAQLCKNIPRRHSRLVIQHSILQLAQKIERAGKAANYGHAVGSMCAEIL
jgi:hypothetical protein